MNPPGRSPVVLAGPPPPRAWVWPWRSARFGWAVAALALAGGVPPFLCVPPWCDVTLYDVAARNVLRGGVHYRDVFDTNLPGMVWATAAVRVLCGWSYEALHAWDLLIVGAAAAILGLWARRAGATPAAVAWYAAAVALFYPFSSEMNYCQRDPWMLLPAAVAGWMRLGRLRSAAGGVGRSVAEGFVWGVAVWFKPHVLIPAAAVWLTSAVLLKRAVSGRWIAADFFGLVAGGVLAGVPGVAWLLWSGTWPHFWDVLTRWGPAYTASMWDEYPWKLEWAWWYFPPWSLLHAVAMPLAVLGLWDGLVRARGSGASPSAAGARAVLAAFYLGWHGQAVLLQRGFDYVHAPGLLLAMAVVAARGWAVGFPFLVWFVAVWGVLAVADATPEGVEVARAVNASNHYATLERHPLTDPGVMELWPRCWREGSSLALRDRLGRYSDRHSGITWEDLGAVADFLRTVDPPLRDRELTCWNDGTHPLYLMLGVDPPVRFMHLGTALDIRGKTDDVRREVAAVRHRFVVSDLRRMTRSTARALAPGEDGPLSLPAWVPDWQRGLFPWDQPIVFRSGRYFVHRVDHPPTPDQIVIPDWYSIDAPGPGD